RRRRAPDPRLRRTHGLATSRGPLRTALARAAEPRRAVRLRVPGGARPNTHLGRARAGRPSRARARGRAAGAERARLPGHAAVALPVSDRSRPLGLPRRPRPANGPDDAATGGRARSRAERLDLGRRERGALHDRRGAADVGKPGDVGGDDASGFSERTLLEYRL